MDRRPQPIAACLPFCTRLMFALVALLLIFDLQTSDAADAVPATVSAGNDPAAADLTYEKHVRPILKAHCFHCHGEGEKPKGGLDLRLQRLIVQGGDSGAAVVPEKRDESLLFERIQKGQMPPGDKKLSGEEIVTIGRWIAAGAKTTAPEPAELSSDAVTAEELGFWAFQPVRVAAVPAVKAVQSVRNPIDAFLLAPLEARNLTLSPDAGMRVILRRATFDLLGLPPSPDETVRFLADDSPDAFEKLIDRLLDSPHYGERWARHWLDIAGYADSEGYAPEDTVRPYAYKYRDYVVRAFNADKPYDEFIQEQLAGDEMVSPGYKNLSPAEIDKLVATGFLGMAPDGTASGVDQNVARNQVMAETLKIVSTSLLGLSVGCAECHNHRYDPIPQSDYYRLRAIFEPALDWKNWRSPPMRLISLATDADREQSAKIEAEAVALYELRNKKQKEYVDKTFDKELLKLPEAIRESIRAARDAAADKRTPEQVQLLKEYPSVNVTGGSLYLYDQAAADEVKKDDDKIAALRATKPLEDFVRALTEVPGNVPTTFLFNRGDFAQPRQPVAPGELTVLASANRVEIPVKSPAIPGTGRRTAYARSLSSGTHPLTGRVLVNRIWMHHFGRGIVATPADFGFLGDRPSHPELLDWLANEFVVGGWRLKRMHRLMMTSAAYRQSSTRTAAHDGVDPENRLFGRMNVRRLEAEALRDAILDVSGKFNSKMFGIPVPVMEDEVGQFVIGIENKNGENRPGPELPMHGEEFRRSLYVQARRSRPLAVLETFDVPAMAPNCQIRSSSTVTPQALMLMNSRFVVTHADYFAERVRTASSGGDGKAQVELAWRLAFGVEPSAEDVGQSLAFLTAQAEHFKSVAASQPVPAAPAGMPPAKLPDPELQALASFCQSLISANPFLYVD